MERKETNLIKEQYGKIQFCLIAKKLYDVCL